MPKQIVQASEVPTDSDLEEEMVEVRGSRPPTTVKGVAGGVKRPLSEAKLKALELARVKAAQKAKQRSAVTKSAKEAERAKKMADKVNAFALQQKARAIESGLMYEAPPATVEPAAVVSSGSQLDDIKSELRALRELMSKPAVPPAPVVEQPNRGKKKPARAKQLPPVTTMQPTRIDALKAMLGR